MTTVTRAVMLKGKEVVAIMSFCLALKEMTPEQQRNFLKVLWIDWRNKDDACKEVMEGVETFFDMWFGCDADYQRMLDVICEGTHPSFKDEAMKEAREIADSNLKQIRKLNNPIVETKIESFIMPATTEAN